MRPRSLFALALLLAAAAASGHAPLPVALAQSVPAAQKVWIYFRDKGPAPEARRAEVPLSPRALARRALRGDTRTVTLEDVPLVPTYVSSVAARVARVRHEVPWLNAMSVEASTEQIAALQALPFVARVERVRGYRRRTDEDVRGRVRSDAQEVTGVTPASAALDYGPSAGQLSQIGVPAVHDLGLHGQGVMIAVFDAGFDTLSHEAFAAMAIADRHDFVNGDEDVGDGGRGEGSHGTATLSVIGGYAPGHLIGPAFQSTYLLAKTEDTDSETPVEEDNWAAAVVWAEARGADVISSSLGYLTFDPGSPSYTFAEMNGSTAISTRAAEMAAARGIVVVNSAGNEGLNLQQNTLIAPADGRLVLAVGAVTSSGSRASFSSVGPTSDGRIKPDVLAQGVLVTAAAPDTASGYTTVNGTSFSCPLTAGVVALMVQARPSASVLEIEDAIRATASQAAQPDNQRGFGIVNAAAAVAAISR